MVADDEFKNLTTYMRDLHQYYIVEATETGQMGFEVIIRHPLVFHYPLEEKHFVGWECFVSAIPEARSRYTNIDDVDYVSTLHA